MTIDKYFRGQAKKLAYLELKNEKEKYLDYGLNDIALPIISDELMIALQNDHFENEVDSKYIMDGMLFNLGIDPEFKYASDYKNVLWNMIDRPTKYAVARGVEALEKDMLKAAIFFRAGHILDPKDNFATYNYARLLWRLDLTEDQRPEFVAKSIELLETILRKDESFSLAYYELANIYKELGQYIKSMSYYRNALERVDMESIKEDIRQKMNEIEADALVEEAISYISRMDYAKAITLLQESQRNVNRYDVLYYLAVCYMNLEDFPTAEEYFEKALDGGADFATIYIDYIYVLYSSGKILDALRLADIGLDKYPADLKIRYNRALIYVELGKIGKAIEDLDFILEYADLSDEFYSQVKEIRDSIVG